MRKLLSWVLVLGLMVAGGASADFGVAAGYPLAYTTYNSEGNEIEQVLASIPNRVYCNNQISLEIMLMLGLEDHIIGTPVLANPIWPGLEDAAKKIHYLDAVWPSKEMVVGLEPDMVVGRAALFQDTEYGIGTVEDYNAMGISVYCNTSLAKSGATVADIVEDIRFYGELFDVRDRAEAFAAALQAKLASVRQRLSDVAEAKTALLLVNYHDNEFSAYAANTGISASVLSELRCVSAIPADGSISGTFGAEQVVGMNPDIILYVDYSTSVIPSEQAIAEIMGNEALASVTAIRDGAIYTAGYNDLMGGGFQAIYLLETLLGQIYPERA